MNTIGIIKRHLNSIKNIHPLNMNEYDSGHSCHTRCTDYNAGHEQFSTWRTSPIKQSTQQQPSPNTATEYANCPTPPVRTLLRSYTSEYSPYVRGPRNAPPIMRRPEKERNQDRDRQNRSGKSRRGEGDRDRNKIRNENGDPFLTPPPSPRVTPTILPSPVTPTTHTLAFASNPSPSSSSPLNYQHSQQQHSSILINPLTDNFSSPPTISNCTSSSMDVDILGLSVVVEDISSIMNRMTLFVDPNCGNLLRFSSEQPLLPSSLLTLASSMDTEAQCKQYSSSESNDCGNFGSGGSGNTVSCKSKNNSQAQSQNNNFNVTVVCHTTSRISSLLTACDEEDKRLAAMVTKGEVDGLLCLQTDVEEVLHSKTIQATIAAGLPIVAVGLASAQQLMQMGGKVIGCYDLSLAPLASSTASLSPFLSPTATSRCSSDQSTNSHRHVMSASYSYFLPAEQLCDESLGYYVASSFAAHWMEDKVYSIPQPRHSQILHNIIRRTLLLFGFIILFHWLLMCLHNFLVLEESGSVEENISLLNVISPTSVILQPYIYFAMIIFSYTCLHFAYPIESPEKALFKRQTNSRRRSAIVFRALQFIFYKHSRKYVFRLIATAFLFVFLMKYSLFSTLLLLPVHPQGQHGEEIDVGNGREGVSAETVHVCARYALSIAYGLGAFCGTLQYFSNSFFNKIVRKPYHGLCDLTSIGFSFFATGTAICTDVLCFCCFCSYIF